MIAVQDAPNRYNMKQQLVAHLSQEYPSTRQGPEHERWKALRVDINEADKLNGLVWSQRDERDFGLKCWSLVMDRPRNILISDYLRSSIYSTQINACEAMLHHHELDDWIDRLPHWRSYESRGQANPNVQRPIGDSVYADIGDAMIDMHLAGFFRSVASALDCFAACVAIVHGCAHDVLRIQHKDIVPSHSKLKWTDQQRAALDNLHHMSRDKIAGDWIDWASKVRNTYVHRPRRLMYSAPRLKHALHLSPDHATGFLNVQHFLPSQPHLTEVQQWREPSKKPTLSETAQTTTRLCADALVRYLRAGFEALCTTWTDRVSGKLMIEQNAQAQWPDILKPTPSEFEGFAPDDVPLNPEAIMGNEELLNRLRYAGVLDADRQFWVDVLAAERAGKDSTASRRDKSQD